MRTESHFDRDLSDMQIVKEMNSILIQLGDRKADT